MTETLSDQLAEALIARGWAEQPRGKYRKFTKRGEHNLYVGDAGALRYGQNASTSRSMTGGKFYKELLGTANLPSVDLKL